ncbi:MAG: hypothetical protein WCQ26_13595, partial [Pseudanabaena sp. ELA748]
GVQSVIRVTRSGERDGKSYSTLSYYLSSLPPESNRIAKVIRGHWQVENRGCNRPIFSQYTCYVVFTHLDSLLPFLEIALPLQG